MTVQMATERDEMKKNLEDMAEYWDAVGRGETNLPMPILPEAEEDREYWKFERQLRLEEINNRLGYDPVERKNIRYKDLEEKYGADLAEEIVKAKEEGRRYDSEVYKAVMAIHNRKITADTKKIETTNSQPLKAKKKVGQFISTSFELLDNPQYLKNYASKPLVYQYLRRFIVRGKQRDDKLSLYEKYYQTGKLVSSLSQRRLAEEFGLSKTTINKYLKELEADGVIKVKVVPAKDAWDKRQHSIYELGTHTGKNEVYYMDEKYGPC